VSAARRPAGSLALLLASASPRRRELVESMGYAALVTPAEVEEWEAADADPAALVAHNAALKAAWAAARHPASPVLAADTLVVLGPDVLEKPADAAEARAMLRRLAGRAHVVHTGVSLRWSERGTAHDFVETSRVFFKPFDDATIEAYFACVDPLDKAGAYGIQEGRDLIIDHWEGSLHNIMGLPTERLTGTFEQLGWSTLLKRIGA
jgi:septum formation protein